MTQILALRDKATAVLRGGGGGGRRGGGGGVVVVVVVVNFSSTRIEE